MHHRKSPHLVTVQNSNGTEQTNIQSVLKRYGRCKASIIMEWKFRQLAVHPPLQLNTEALKLPPATYLSPHLNYSPGPPVRENYYGSGGPGLLPITPGRPQPITGPSSMHKLLHLSLFFVFLQLLTDGSVCHPAYEARPSYRDLLAPFCKQASFSWKAPFPNDTIWRLSLLKDRENGPGGSFQPWFLLAIMLISFVASLV